MGKKGKRGKKGAGGKGGKGKAEEEEEEKARECLVQELLRVADRFQAGGLFEHCLAEFGRVLTVDGDGDRAAGVGARACSRGGAGGRDGGRGGQRTCDPEGRRKHGGLAASAAERHFCCILCCHELLKRPVSQVPCRGAGSVPRQSHFGCTVRRGALRDSYRRAREVGATTLMVVRHVIKRRWWTRW